MINVDNTPALIAAILKLAEAILALAGAITIVVNKVVGVLKSDHPMLPTVKFLGNIVNRDQVTDDDRPLLH